MMCIFSVSRNEYQFFDLIFFFYCFVIIAFLCCLFWSSRSVSKEIPCQFFGSMIFISSPNIFFVCVCACEHKKKITELSSKQFVLWLRWKKRVILKDLCVPKWLKQEEGRWWNFGLEPKRFFLKTVQREVFFINVFLSLGLRFLEIKQV